MPPGMGSLSSAAQSTKWAPCCFIQARQYARSLSDIRAVMVWARSIARRVNWSLERSLEDLITTAEIHAAAEFRELFRWANEHGATEAVTFWVMVIFRMNQTASRRCVGA
jgi:hypothetical protein